MESSEHIKTGTTAPRPATSDCRYLRCKNAHVPNDFDPEGWRRTDRTRSSFWCLKTMLTSGPDHDLVCAADCQPGRACFVSNDTP